MKAALAFVSVLLAIALVIGWCLLWGKIAEWVEEIVDSETLGMCSFFVGAFGLPIAALVAAIVGSMP